MGLSAKNILLLIALTVTSTVNARKIYATDNESRADIKVFVTDNENRADLVVYRTDNESRANDNGIWYFTHN